MTGARRYRLMIALLVRGVPAGRRQELVDELLADAASRPGGRHSLRAAWWFFREAHSIGRAYRRHRRGLLLETVWRDTRLGLRSYARTPLFTLVALLTIALGIGATSTMFSLANAVLIRPLPYPSPQRLVRVYQTKRQTGRNGALSPPNYFDLKDQMRAFQSVAAYWSPNVTLTSPGADPEKILAATCSYDLFTTLDVAPMLGRGFLAEDDVPGSGSVAILGYGLWQRRYGGDTAVLGREVSLDGRPTVIVGVMPASFDFPGTGTELWAPLRLSRTQPPNPAIPVGQYRQYRILSVIARLRPDESLAQARERLADAARPLEQAYPDANRDMTLTAVPLHDAVVGPIRSAFLLLLAAVACVLLIACANVGSLMLVRATTREPEVAVRIALGATRSRIAAQMLTESVGLALGGGALGLLASRWALPVVIRIAPAGVPRIDQIRIDATAVAVTAAISVLAGLAFGLAPAWPSRTNRVQDTLRRSGRSVVGGTNTRLRHAFVVAELGLSLALVVVAGLLVQSLLRMQGVDVGFRPAAVLTFDRIELPGPRAQPDTSAIFFDELLAETRAIPGVESAGATLGLPLDPRAHFYVDETTFSLVGQPPFPIAQRPTAPLHVVTPGYFATVGVPIVRGRAFAAGDRAGAQPVVIINESMARRYWPDQNPIGRRLTHDLAIVPGQATTREIVGVVGDIRHFGLEQPADAQLYIPHAQMPWPSMAIVLKTTSDPGAVTAAFRRAVWKLDGTLPVPAMRPLGDVVAGASGDSRFRAWLLGLFAAIALLLACVGLYGTVAYTVQQRTSEVALRLALGASARQARRVILREGLRLVVTGVAVGCLVAAVAARAISGLLFGVSAADPATFIAVPVMLGAIGWLACYIPARRAGAVDPLRAMRGD